MHNDLLPVIEELERVVQAGDAHAAATILRRLNEVEIYSGNDVYDRLHAVEPDLGIVLFDGLGPAAFSKLIANDRHLYKFAIWQGLETVAERISTEALWDIKDDLGFPSSNECPKLYAILADAEDGYISDELIQTIVQHAIAESLNGSSLSAHERTMSEFRYVRWSTDDKGLSECVHLLASRRDSRASCARYLMELPWGADRRATMALLDGMVATGAPQNQALFHEALSVHRNPMILRTWLWGAIGDDNPRECLIGAITDLKSADNDADRVTLIDFLGSALSQIASRHLMLEWSPISAAAESVDTSAWTRILRGYYGAMLKVHLPDVNAKRVSNNFDRATIAVARAWEFVRIDHMGCLIPLAVMITIGWLVSFGFDRLLGLPVRIRWLPVALFWTWIAWAVINMRTHFSGYETVQGKVRTGITYFALILGWLLTEILVRVG